ncbi:MAG: DUF4055 domain-containing protein, partial [Rhodospirillales bacterium]|nr:DUF4055 domain-containing protein [Rhodospirillales bacterium]
SQSDQDNSLHVARVPMLAVIGVEAPSQDGLPGNEITIGTNAATYLPLQGDMKFVEHTGKAIEAGRQSLLDLEDQMRMAGAKLLQKEKQATKTAAQAEEEAAQELSPLETMAGSFEDAIDQVLQYFAMWMGVDEGGHCEVNGNFDVDYDIATTLPFLQTMNDRTKLSDQSFFEEVQRRGILDRLEIGAEAVAQTLEPGARRWLQGIMPKGSGGIVGNQGHRGLFLGHREGSRRTKPVGGGVLLGANAAPRLRAAFAWNLPAQHGTRFGRIPGSVRGSARVATSRTR